MPIPWVTYITYRDNVGPLNTPIIDDHKDVTLLVQAAFDRWNGDWVPCNIELQETIKKGYRLVAQHREVGKLIIDVEFPGHDWLEGVKNVIPSIIQVLNKIWGP